MAWSRVRAALPSCAFMVVASIIAMSVMVGVTSQPTSAAPAPVYGRYCSSGAPIRSVPTSDKVVSFTFDDGPWPTNTAAVMSTFERYGWRANFFMIGSNIRQYPAIARSVVQRGHGVGAHTVTHRYSSWTIASEAAPSRDILQSVTGVRSTFFRAPGLTMSSTIDRAVYAAGMCNISTASDLGDWRSPRASSWTLCDRMRRNLRPGAIFLLHDGGSHRQTVDAVSCMLDTVRRNGYQVVDLGALLSRRYSLSTPPPPAPSTTCQTSSYGQRSSAVAAAQRAVMNTGIYLRGGADGHFGSYTRSAVITFQAARGLPRTGGVDRATATALGICPAASAGAPTTPATPPTTWTTVRIGQRGATVAAMQRAIIASGIYLVGGADGIFGRYSEAALRTYQANRGIPATGVLDQATAIKMGLFKLPTPAATTTTSTTTTSTTTTQPESTTSSSSSTTSSTSTTTSSSSSTTPPSEPAPGAVTVVWYDADGDQQRGDSEVGVEGLEMRLVDTVAGSIRTVTTGPDGAFDIGEVLPGSYRLEVVLPANRSLSAPGADAAEFEVVAVVDRPDVPERVGTVSFAVTTTLDELGLELALFDTP